MVRECKICDKLKAKYISARKYLNRTREDFIIGTIIIIFFGGLLEFIISGFLISLLRLTGKASGSLISSLLSMGPGWWVMVSFVAFLTISIPTVMIILFIGRRKSYVRGKQMLNIAIININEKICPNCRDSLPAVL